MTVQVSDPFAVAEDLGPEPVRRSLVTGGRYRLPNRDGTHRPYGWQRVTNLVGAISDQRRLQDWELRTVLQGVATDSRLYAELVDYLSTGPDRSSAEYRDLMTRFASRAKEAGGGNDGARWGSARHVEWERYLTDPDQVHGPERRRFALLRQALAEAGLEPVPGWQEQRVLVEELEAVGTLDNLLWDHRWQVHRIGDLKTQRKVWTWLEIEAQLACYARATARWVPDDPADPTVGRWEDMPPVDRSLGVVLSVPRVPDPGAPEVEIKGVDLERGWVTAQLAYQVVRQRSAARSTRAPRSGWSWVSMPAWARVEQYGRAFARVTTVREGREVTRAAMADGVWGPELQAAARRAVERVTGFAQVREG